MTIDAHTATLLKKLSKDESAFEQLLTLFQAQNSPESGYRKADSYQDVATYHAYLLDIVEDAIISINLQGQIVSWNYAAEKMYGWATHEVLGRRLKEVISPEYLTRTIEDVTAQLYKEGIIEGEFIHQRRDGSKFYIHTITSRIQDDDGEITGYVSINRDITARKESERRLSDSEQFLRAILEGTHTGIFVVHVTETEDFRYISLNPAHEKATGFKTQDIQGKTPEEISGISPEAAATLRANYNRCLKNRQTITYEERITTIKGKETWWLTQLTPLFTPAGRIHTIVGTTLDITERKRMEQASEELVRLEIELEKERELRSFQTRVMTMITHDFKTPLATIQTSTDLLKNHADRFTGESIIKRLDRIQAQVSILDELVDATIALRRSEIYEYTPQPEHIELVPFLKNIIDDVCNYTEHECMVSLAPAGENNGLFDATLLRQIAMNLIMNAVKYSPPTNKVCVRYHCDAEALEFIVEDSGIGIPEENQEHIFKLFYRADNAVNLQGNGMGLAIVKQAVDWHGGSIEMKSKVDVGTTFTVKLPQLT